VSLSNLCVRSETVSYNIFKYFSNIAQVGNGYVTIEVIFRQRCLLKNWVYMCAFKIIRKYPWAQWCTYDVCYWSHLYVKTWFSECGREWSEITWFTLARHDYFSHFNNCGLNDANWEFTSGKSAFIKPGVTVKIEWIRQILFLKWPEKESHNHLIDAWVGRKGAGRMRKILFMHFHNCCGVAQLFETIFS